MPVNILRLNPRRAVPNERIIFIKPLEGQDKPTAEDFLNSLAAICSPIMKKNHLSVMTLEEFPPNREFWGRNFNAGECIQLVLKAPGTGRWLSFRFVQMVLMHELAHCNEMHHGRSFWRLRNQYVDELRALWDRGYLGDGLWGRGQSLYDGQFTTDSIPEPENIPDQLCGGAYRTARRKRKRASTKQEPSQLSYAERKQRRIEKKFGKGGVALGKDESARLALESGRVFQGNPRVAKSGRGRELRAAAALARLQHLSDPGKSNQDTESETDDSETEELESPDDSKDGIVCDSKGRTMVNVCEGADALDDEAQNEIKELGFKREEQPPENNKPEPDCVDK